MSLINDRFIKACFKQPVDSTPVWLMRQAGRYMPEYREVRAAIPDFMTLCKSPELAAKVTLQPIERFDLDAAIIFSDILTIPDAMGLGLKFMPGEGPMFTNPIKNMHDLKAAKKINMTKDLGYVFEAISQTKRLLKNKIPLIGFSGSPWTLACYMIQGQGSRDFHKAKACLYQEPQTLHALLDALSNTIIDYLNHQIAAGADAIMLFDTWGGILTPDAYQEFSLHYLAKICEGISRTDNTPRIIFTKGAGQWLETIANTIDCEVVGLDWTTDINHAFNRIGDQVALQGNLDPAILQAPADLLEQHIESLLNAVGNRPGHIFNLGHGITPNINPERVKTLVDHVHHYSSQLKHP